MSATKHTPGPWLATEWGVRNSGGYIAHTYGVQRYEGQDARYVREVDQREADKLLIAAAPDLILALRDAVAALGGIMSDNVSQTVRAAITKATGSAA